MIQFEGSIVSRPAGARCRSIGRCERNDGGVANMVGLRGRPPRDGFHRVFEFVRHAHVFGLRRLQLLRGNRFGGKPWLLREKPFRLPSCPAPSASVRIVTPPSACDRVDIDPWEAIQGTALLNVIAVPNTSVAGRAFMPKVCTGVSGVALWITGGSAGEANSMYRPSSSSMRGIESCAQSARVPLVTRINARKCTDHGLVSDVVTTAFDSDRQSSPVFFHPIWLLVMSRAVIKTSIESLSLICLILF